MLRFDRFLHIAFVAALACTSMPALALGPDVAPIAALPAPRLTFTDSEMALADSVSPFPGLADFYGTNGLKPVFTAQDGAPLRRALIEAVGQAASHGLPPSRYNLPKLMVLDAAEATDAQAELTFAQVFADWSHDLGGGILNPKRLDPTNKRDVLRRDTADVLREFQKAADPQQVLAALAPSDPRYQFLRNALARRSGTAVPAGTPRVPEGLWREGAEGAAILALRQRLGALGFDAGASGNPAIFDAGLKQALQGYQSAAGLPADGVAGPQTVRRLNGGAGQDASAILISLERMRWLAGHDLNARHVWVNLPEYNARIVEGGQEVFETRVVIGKTGDDYATPEFSDEMEYLVVNPRWNVPRSITVREYLPRLQANRNAVSHLDLVDRNGNVIARDRIDFRQYTASNFPFRMRQKPSDDNALGVVKFMFPNPWNIYLHDTPTKHLFNQSARAYSHGCIRIGRPLDLAYELMKGSFDDPQASFEKARATGRETYFNLRPTIPVHLVYFTAFPDSSGKIRYYNDVYGRDAKIYAALQRVGVVTSGADE